MPPKLRTLEIVLPVDSARVQVPGADVPTRDVALYGVLILTKPRVVNQTQSKH